MQCPIRGTTPATLMRPASPAHGRLQNQPSGLFALALIHGLTVLRTAIIALKTPLQAGFFIYNKAAPMHWARYANVSGVCKPSSVLDGHLSRPAVARQAPAITRERDGPPHVLPYQSCTRWGLQSGQVAKPLVSSYLAFPPLRPPKGASRYISVALSLESPPPAVNRHPALCELGLSSDGQAACGRPAPSRFRLRLSAGTRTFGLITWGRKVCGRSCRTLRSFLRV